MLKNQNGENLTDQIYPIGSIYISVNSNNPSSYFGGEWESFGKGRTIVGIDPDQEEFNTAEKTGGEKEHTLLIGEMPRHRHNGEGGPIMIAGGSGRKQIDNGSNARYGYTDYQGNDEPHNNLQPYITCYMWKRIA